LEEREMVRDFENGDRKCLCCPGEVAARTLIRTGVRQLRHGFWEGGGGDTFASRRRVLPTQQCRYRIAGRDKKAKMIRPSFWRLSSGFDEGQLIALAQQYEELFNS
jgi:hypothetical protein